MIGIHRLTQACPTNPSRSRNWDFLNCAILSIVSQLVSIDRKVGLDSEITISCYLHLCHSIFISFPIMFIALWSKLISNAPIDTAFWSCCLLCFSHLLRFRMRVTFFALIYWNIFPFPPHTLPPTPMQNFAFNFLGTRLRQVLQCPSICCTVFCNFLLRKNGANPSTLL